MALSRKFNGKLYHFEGQHMFKGQAEGHANRLRKAGNRARVTFGNSRWLVWAR